MAWPRWGLSCFVIEDLESMLYRRCKILKNDKCAAMHPGRQWYDKEFRGSTNDLTSLGGLVVAVRDCMRLKVGALMHGGHPCNMLPGN